MKRKIKAVTLGMIVMLGISTNVVQGKEMNLMPIGMYNMLNITKIKTPNIKNQITEKEKNEKILANSGTIVLPEYLEKVKIYKDASSKSEMIGYARNKDVVQIEYEMYGYYKIKSGNVKGYVKTQYVETDKKGVEYLLTNECVKAKTIKKTKIYKTEKLKKTKGYVNIKSEMQVIKIKDDCSALEILMSDETYGYIKTKDIVFKIKGNHCITRSEYQKYQLEKEKERINAIQQVESKEKIEDIVSEIICHNESGDYGAARNGLPQFSGEKTITVGAWQWYGERAHSLLRKIVNNYCYTDEENKCLNKLIKDIKGSDNWEQSERNFSAEELNIIKRMLTSNSGIRIQEEQARKDIEERIKIAHNTYGLTNEKLVAYFCDMFWQNPVNARKVINESIKESKTNINKNPEGINIIHKNAMKNSVLGKFTTRRAWTYEVTRQL